MLEVIKAFICCLIFMITLYIYGLILFDERRQSNNIKSLIIFILLCILHTIIFLYTKGAIKTILLCIIYATLLKEIYKINISKSIFASIVYAIITIIPDLLTMSIALNIFGISKEYYYSNLAGGIICNLSVIIITVIITYILRKPLRKIINYNLSTNKKIILIAFLTLISLAIFFYTLINKFKSTNDVLGYSIVIITLITILFYLFKQKIDNDMIVKKYDELLDIMKNYERDIEEQRTLIHETKNEMMTIKSKIKDKENSKDIIEYIDSILGDKISTNMTKYSKFMYLPSNGLKGFFYYKFIEAEKRGINVSVNISQKIEHSFLGKLDTNKFKELVRIIGVYLDNAIEASEKSNKKNLGIEIYVINKNVEIIISNTYLGKIESEKVGEEKYSTKGKNRGHGLLLVKKILSENKIFSAERKITNELYIQKIIIRRTED